MNIFKFKNHSSKINSDDGEPKLPPKVQGGTKVVEESEKGRLMSIISILRSAIGVPDISNLRLSLPANLLDPIPNLEFWHYMDAPDLFLAIDTEADKELRALSLLKWWFSKDSRYTKMKKIIKPYNSTLGEQFFCYWEPKSVSSDLSVGSDDTIVESAYSSNRIEYIVEQVSHHPPVSAFCYRSNDKSIEAFGLDHISAKFTGLSATIKAGDKCKGVYVNLRKWDEEYRVTSAQAQVIGWLTGNLRISIVESIRMCCNESKVAAIIEFYGEKKGYMKRFTAHGFMFKFNPETDDINEWNIKDIPEDREKLYQIYGDWNKVMYYRKYGTDIENTLIDVGNIAPAKMNVKPIEEMNPLESRVIWKDVTENILQKKFGDATNAKRKIENYHRTLAQEQEKTGSPFQPKLFAVDYSTGKPSLLPTASINM